MDETRIAIGIRIKLAALCATVFSLFYNVNAWYASTLDYVPSFIFSFEKYTPFIAWTVIPYMTSGIFFVIVFFLCKTRQELQTLTKRVLFVSVVGGLFFLLFPLKFSFIKPETSTILFNFFFQFIEKVDSPFNEAPSLHIAFAFIFWSVFRNLKNAWRYVAAVWLMLLGLSTLTTYQHHLLDVVTGAILGQLSFIVFPAQDNNFKLRSFHLANYYFLGSWLVILLSLVVFEFYHASGLILLWPTLVLFLVGYHYQKNSIYFLKNNQGTIPWYKKIVYFPYIGLYWLFWKFLRKNKKPIELIPKLYVSSRLDYSEFQNFNGNQNTLVYDFSAELEENKAIKQNCLYNAVPLLDIGAFDIIEIKRIVLEITTHYKELPKGGKILIHCTIGVSRSTFIGILVVKNILSLPLDEAVLKIKTTHKNAVIHSYVQDFLKTINI
ncbi:phosphatase PAP2 family protein [Cellulophaga sp. HaHaR_3_176]|uniref:phosphatase PAP2 family protein n=1 Tax=Cellulophaga sp. HaHaR_3_176 TaxID=1942464 RepID=UPI001C1FCEB2|nr:phosphatase PAP2 family protein [Cellulophaga sp. HaHaR_3_176]QWX85120.1 phosphatase PAP2 family protein [Cellulophaga sp. HaHaR_3_176]